MEELKRQISNEKSQERQEMLAKLVSELCALNLAIAMAKPSEFAKFHVSKLDEESPGPSQAPPEMWKRCMVRFANARVRGQRKSLRHSTICLYIYCLIK